MRRRRRRNSFRDFAHSGKSMLLMMFASFNSKQKKENEFYLKCIQDGKDELKSHSFFVE